MGHPKSNITFGIPHASPDGKYYSRYPNGDRPAIGPGITINVSAPTGSASGGAETFDFYIGPAGSDSNPGTLAQPWAITALNTKRSTYAGKKVGLLDGTYLIRNIFGDPFGTGVSAWDDNFIKVAGGSSDSQRTVIKAVNRYGAILDGQRSGYSGSAPLKKAGVIGPVYAASYITIDGLKVINTNYRAINNEVQSGGGSSYLTIQNCWFRDQFYISGNDNPADGENSSVIFTQEKVGTVIRNNLFEECGAPSDCDRHAFIQFYKGDDTVVEYNTIIGNGPRPALGTWVNGNGKSGNGIHYKGNYNSDGGRPSRRATIRWNYIHSAVSGNSAIGIQFHADDDIFGYSITDQNYIIGNVVITNGSSFYLSNCISPLHITDNTFVSYNDCPVNYLVGIDTSAFSRPLPTAIEIMRNIIVIGSGSYTIHRLGPLSTLSAIDYNFHAAPAGVKLSYAWNEVAYSGSSADGLAAMRTVLSAAGIPGAEAHSAAATSITFVNTGTDAAKYQVASGAALTLGPGGVLIGAHNSGGDEYGPGQNVSRL